MKVMLAGEVEPRSSTESPSSREMARMNSLNPVERRLTLCFEENSSSALSREPPNSFRKMPGATGHHCIEESAGAATVGNVRR